MLIRNAEIWQQGVADVRITGAMIDAVGSLVARDGEQVIDAQRGALLPGLHDHHMHLAALAVANASIRCGPPNVKDRIGLAKALTQPGTGWLRGIGYHESIAGMLDAELLDSLQPHRPVRIQHRSGRMWFLNTAALSLLLNHTAPPPGFERQGDRWTGRLFDEDRWLRDALQSQPPAFADASIDLARMGVTGLTDMSPANDPVIAAHFARQQASGGLLQRCVLAGSLSLVTAEFGERLCPGPAKLHLHENALPDIDDTIAFLRSAHAQGCDGDGRCCRGVFIDHASQGRRASGHRTAPDLSG